MPKQALKETSSTGPKGNIFILSLLHPLISLLSCPCPLLPSPSVIVFWLEVFFPRKEGHSGAWSSSLSSFHFPSSTRLILLTPQGPALTTHKHQGLQDPPIVAQANLSFGVRLSLCGCGYVTPGGHGPEPLADTAASGAANHCLTQSPCGLCQLPGFGLAFQAFFLISLQNKKQREQVQPSNSRHWLWDFALFPALCQGS